VRAFVVAAALGLSGCATTATPAPRAAPSPALQERAATLFDAATHGDEPRLKTMVDWTRWRTVAGLRRCRSDADAAEVLSRIEAEPEPSAGFVDGAAHEVRARLAEVASGSMPPRPRSGVMNATLAGWRRPPPPGDGTPPSLARLRTLVAESLEGTEDVTYEGARRVTLVFAGNLLVGVVDAR
jgi:hypothetical protein